MSENGQGMSQSAYARHRAARGLSGTSRQAVNQAIKSGRIQLNSRGRINPEEADKAWPGRAPAPKVSQGQAGPQDQDSAKPTAYQTAREEREVYAAELARLKLERARGEVLERAKVEETWTRVLQTLRDHLLTIPVRVSELLAAQTDPGEVSRVLTQEIREGLEGAARGIS